MALVEMRSKRKQGLTIGEASRMLGIPQFWVIRLFAQGILTGRRELVTGWMVIDRENGKALAKESEIELPSKRQMEKDLKAKALKRKWPVIPVTQKEG